MSEEKTVAPLRSENYNKLEIIVNKYDTRAAIFGCIGVSSAFIVGVITLVTGAQESTDGTLSYPGIEAILLSLLFFAVFVGIAFCYAAASKHASVDLQNERKNIESA